MNKAEVHTTPNPNGPGWVNESSGIILDNGMVYRLKSAAYKRGREIARENKTEHVTHDRHGVIRSKNSYGNDPKGGG